MKTTVDYSNDHILKLIDTYIHSERDRLILKRRLVDGLLYKELEEEFHLSMRQIKRIVYKGSDKIFRHLRDPV